MKAGPYGGVVFAGSCLRIFSDEKPVDVRLSGSFSLASALERRSQIRRICRFFELESGGRRSSETARNLTKGP